jgi:NAD(P)-dependent dehydrogenase (short-subunit alcohol dehydrogenase family)
VDWAFSGPKRCFGCFRVTQRSTTCTPIWTLDLSFGLYGRPARVVNIGTRIDTAMQLDDLNFANRPYTMMRAYAESKLGLIHFTRALARRTAGSGVTVHCLFPGVFRSNLGGTDGGQPLMVRLFARLFGCAVPSPEPAAGRVVALLESDSADACIWAISSRMTGLPID